MTSTVTLDSAAVLAAARRERADADAAEARLLQRALEWADLHQVDDSATRIATFGDTPVSLAGDGGPHVSHFAVLEFGAVVGMSRRSTEALFADVLELGHRLPRTWARVVAGELRSRLIDAAIARYMPGYAEQVAAAAEESQFLQIAYDQPSYTGTCRLAGELDLADAQDLEQAVQAGAEQQRSLGSALPLGARRAKALGNLARGELVFDYSSGLPEPAPTAAAEPLTAPTVRPRQVLLYLHLNADGTAALENAGKHLVTRDQVREWCRTAGTVTVRPVIDLNQEITSPGYRPSDLLAEQVTLRDGWCPFPWCECAARHGDKDHIERYDPDGPPGQTTSSNLGSPCRTHHRLKTFGGWTYTMLEPGSYLWRSPHGYQFLKDRTGTRDLTPRPVDPPGRAPA